MEAALGGVRVLDISEYVAGPYCGRILAGFGADVIKVEKPRGGDIARSTAPFLADVPGLERSGLFLYLNVNKKGITLDPATDTGAGIFRELVKDVDVVIESFSPGFIGSCGLGFSELKVINPKLVMCSVTPFGQNGPYRDYNSSHLVAWGMSGGHYTNGQPGTRPWQGPNPLTEYLAGCCATAGILSAVYRSGLTGSGEHIDVSTFESMLLMVAYPPVLYSFLDKVHTSFAINFLGVFPCKDGYIGINFLTTAQWHLICQFFGMPELIEDPRFENHATIIQHLDEARAIFAPKIAEWNTMDLFLAATEWRVPAGLIPTTAEIAHSPQHEAREFFIEIEHSIIGKIKMPGAPFKMKKTPWQTKCAAPLLGEHNEEIYCGRMGYSRKDLIALSERGII
jgi:crotonobetainyl-CoA:carnitine CoA-transferase CaiB-like acyl-CoA transferase